MAKKLSETKVTRISASDEVNPVAKTKRSAKASESKREKVVKSKPERNNPVTRFFGYFKGAWKELRQVHWPTRRATWGLTGAVLLFSLFFVVFITGLDAGFKFLFEQILR